MKFTVSSAGHRGLVQAECWAGRPSCWPCSRRPTRYPSGPAGGGRNSCCAGGGGGGGCVVDDASCESGYACGCGGGPGSRPTWTVVWRAPAWSC